MSDFITERRCLIVRGTPGRGSTHLAIALASRDIHLGRDALVRLTRSIVSPRRSVQSHHITRPLCSQPRGRQPQASTVPWFCVRATFCLPPHRLLESTFASH